MIPTELKNERILLSCLNWGKGHVARCIGLIEELLAQNNEVIIAGDTDQLAIFKTYFPVMECIEIPAYPFHFSGKGNFATDLWKSRKGLFQAISEERLLLAQMMKDHKISLILSDHRYGFQSNSIRSVFITHQLNLPLKWWQFPAQILHDRLVSSFSEIWIMDTEQNFLAGKLSASKKRKNARYIGHYSRFTYQNNLNQLDSKVVICNGPSPYDEQLLVEYLDQKEFQIIASDHLQQKYQTGNIISASDWKKCDELIVKATEIHAYCGYSTLMDAQFLKANFVLKPTKGQLEQEYLYSLYLDSNK